MLWVQLVDRAIHNETLELHLPPEMPVSKWTPSHALITTHCLGISCVQHVCIWSFSKVGLAFCLLPQVPPELWGGDMFWNFQKDGICRDIFCVDTLTFDFVSNLKAEWFLSDPGLLVRSMCLEVSEWVTYVVWNITDVTPADEDTNSILTDKVIRTIQGNVAKQL